jgi:hypothetical protein
MEMNIGETDADGWTYVRFGDAAKAAQDGTHEVEARPGSTCSWVPMGIKDHYWNEWQYRIREKARTITVTALPMPLSAVRGVVTARIILDYEKEDQSEKALNIIRAAMRQQP